MIVSIEHDGIVEFPERCPMQHREKHQMFICGHPSLDVGRSHLYCNYCNTPQEFVEASTRCPMIKSPVNNVRIEAH